MEESEKQVKDHSVQRVSVRVSFQKEMQVLREDMNDLCERYKELEQENSQLKQQHSKVLSELKEAESRCLELAGCRPHVQELENALTGAEETVQDVRTVVKTKCVRTLQQKIETVQRTIRTQKGPASSLQQQLLELLTSQAELQEELARLTQS
nr:hypothetical protein BaRGS_032438 [Batillaria attramentaria]